MMSIKLEYKYLTVADNDGVKSLNVENGKWR